MGVRVRLPPAAPKQKVIRKDDLLFWVPAAEGRLHPTVIEMLGRSEFALRRGFASGKTLVRRKGAAGQKAGCSGCIQSFRNFKISILTTLPSSSQATYRLRRAFSFYCKAHRALILLLLASKPQPLCWVAVWVPPCGRLFSRFITVSFYPNRTNKIIRTT